MKDLQKYISSTEEIYNKENDVAYPCTSLFGFSIKAFKILIKFSKIIIAENIS